MKKWKVACAAVVVLVLAGLGLWECGRSGSRTTVATTAGGGVTGTSENGSALAVGGWGPATPATASQVQEALAGVQDQERTVRTLSISAESTYRDLRPNPSQWQYNQECKVEVVFETAPGGRYRIDCATLWRQPLDGASRDTHDAFVIVNEGLIVGTLSELWGDPLVEFSSGPDPPQRLRETVLAAGWVSSLFGNKNFPRSRYDRSDYRMQRFSDFILERRDKPGFGAENVAHDGGDYLRLSFVEHEGHYAGEKWVYFLDKARNHALARFERYLPGRGATEERPNWTLNSTWEVKSFHEPLKNVSYPREIIIEDFLIHGQPSERTEIHVAEVKVNDPAVDARTFSLLVPQGVVALAESGSGGTQSRLLGNESAEERARLIQEARKQAEALARVERSRPVPATQPATMRGK